MKTIITKRLKHYFQLLTILLFSVTVILAALPTTVQAAAEGCADPNKHSELNLCPLPHPDTGTNSLISSALSLVFAVLGAVSLFVITFAGFKYVISRGDPQSMAKAKNTIVYALIGLAVAVSAQLLVVFVINRIT